MNRLKTHSPWWHRLFCLVMAFYVINLSIDAPDGYVTPDAYGEYHEDLSVNEIESIGELVLEKYFGMTDLFPEHDEPEDEEGQISKVLVCWYLPAPAVSYQFTPPSQPLPSVMIPFARTFYSSRASEVINPPPQRRSLRV